MNMPDLAKIILLCNILGFVHSITVSIPERSVNVTEGGTVFLACSFTTTSPTTNLVVQWTLVEKNGAGQPEQVFYYQGGTSVIGSKFKDRVKMLSNPADTKNASISIANMQHADIGVYTCEVDNIPDIEGTNERNILVNVLVKPSAPYCGKHGDVEAGHRVTLTCHSVKGNPAPTYTWKHLEQGDTLGVQDIKIGTMVIQNITEVQFGEYQCVASNGVGSSTCMIDLSEEVHGGVIAGAIIGALLCCGVIVLLVWFITHQMKKQKLKGTKTNTASEMQPMKASTHLAAQDIKGEEDEHPAV